MGQEIFRPLIYFGRHKLKRSKFLVIKVPYSRLSSWRISDTCYDCLLVKDKFAAQKIPFRFWPIKFFIDSEDTDLQ